MMALWLAFCLAGTVCPWYSDGSEIDLHREIAMRASLLYASSIQ